MISIALPVGPKKEHRRWLGECLESLRNQTLPPTDIVLVDDMAGIDPAELPEWDNKAPHIRLWRAPWRMGCAPGWNVGISLAQSDLVFMMGADDWLEPEACEHMVNAWRANRDPLGYYHLTVRYQPQYPGGPLPAGTPDPPVQTLPCNAAFVHKALWKHTGGFPPEVGVGAPDAAFISILLGQKGRAGHLIPVSEGTVLYNWRLHPWQDTAERGPYQGAILAVRNALTELWQPPQWGRYEP